MMLATSVYGVIRKGNVKPHISQFLQKGKCACANITFELEVQAQAGTKGMV